MQPPLAKLSPVNLPIGDTPDKRSVPHKRSVPGIPPPPTVIKISHNSNIPYI